MRTRAVPEVGNRSGAPVAEALALLAANEPEAALRWGAAALERDPSAPLALIVTSRALARIGRRRAAVDGLVYAVERAIDEREAPLALVAVDDLRALGVVVAGHLDRIAAAFCEGTVSPFHAHGALADGGEVDPLSALLKGPALASKATQIVYEAVGVDRPTPAPFPLFGGLSEQALRQVVEAFDVVSIPAGHRVVEQGDEGDAGYLVAYGELEIERAGARGDQPRVVARLGSGAFFGEMALLSRLPAASSVVARRPCILLVARRDTLEGIAARHLDVAFELAAHCRRSAVSNLGRSSPVIAAVPVPERSVLVERLELRVFGRGDRLVRDAEEAPGLHLVVAGEVAVVAREGDERVVLETLGAGATIGEVELVLFRDAGADAIAVRDTATLFLPRDDFFALAQDYPAIVHGLYAIAVKRHLDTRDALEAGSAAVSDDCLFPEVTMPVAPEPSRSFSARAVVDPIPVAKTAVREPIVSAPPSIPPITKSYAPPRPGATGLSSLARISIQGAAAVAVAASVAAVFTARDRRVGVPTVSAGSQTLPTADMAPAASPAPAATTSGPSIVAPTPSQTTAFLTSALRKPRPKPVKLTPAVVASASPSPSEEPRAASAGEEEFGGRE